MRTVPSFHPLAVKIHVETVVNMTALDVTRRKLQTQVRERLVRRAFLRALGAFDGAFDLAVEQSQNEALLGFRVLQPGFL